MASKEGLHRVGRQASLLPCCLPRSAPQVPLPVADNLYESFRRSLVMTQLPLQSDLGIECVAELQAWLQPHLEDQEPVVLSGDRVERVHAAGLQLLLAFVRDRAARGHHTTVTLASPTLAAAARQLGLAVSLGVDTHTGEPA